MKPSEEKGPNQTETPQLHIQSQSSVGKELTSTKWKGGHLKLRGQDGKWDRVWVLIHRSALFVFDKKPAQRSDFEKNALGRMELKDCKVNREVASTSNSRFEVTEFYPSIYSIPKSENEILYHNAETPNLHSSSGSVPFTSSASSSPAFLPFSPTASMPHSRNFHSNPSLSFNSTRSFAETDREIESKKYGSIPPHLASSPKSSQFSNSAPLVNPSSLSVESAKIRKGGSTPNNLLHSNRFKPVSNSKSHNNLNENLSGEEEISPAHSPLHSPPSSLTEKKNLYSFDPRPMKKQLLFSARSPEEKSEWANLIEFAIREPSNWSLIQRNFEKIHKQVKDIKALKGSEEKEGNNLNPPTNLNEDAESALLLEKTIYQMMSSLLYDFSTLQGREEEYYSSFTGSNEQRLIKAQAIVRGWLVRRMIERAYPSVLNNNPTAIREKQKRTIQMEIIESEHEYLSNLICIQQRYMIPFEKTANDEENDDLKLVLFDNLREIAKISKDVLHQLKMPRKGLAPLGQIFLQQLPRMSKTYREYSLNYCDDLQNIVRKKKKNSAFKKFLKNLESDRRNVLSSLLLLPILRLIKYEWLLKEYYALCLKDAPDNRELVDAIKALTNLNQMNELNRETAERFEKIFSISLTFKHVTTELLEAPHEWIREGPLIKMLVTGPERCYLYLLNDAVVVTILLPDGTREFESMIKLDQYLISDMEDSGYIKNCFKLTRREQKGGESHVFGASTNQEKRSWIFDIGEVMAKKKTSSKEKERSKSPVSLSKSSESNINLNNNNNNNSSSTPPISNARAKVRKESSFLWLLEGPVRKCVVDIPSELPKMRLSVSNSKNPILEIDGPNATDNVDPIVSETLPELEVNPVISSIFCKSVSTYPIVKSEDKTLRDGDPIADHFAAKRMSNRLYVAVTDGCNWGSRPQTAARRASAEFINFLHKNSDECVTLEDVGHNLLLAASAAHNSIIKGHEDDIWAAGTTTLLGGIMLQFEQIGANDPQWGFAFLSVGDCKAFLWRNSDGGVIDMTALNRGNLTDVTDPGGRIGPYVGHGAPDLRNLKLYFYECQPGDIVFICSDGVHDNFDPQQLGVTPKQVNSTLDSDNWKNFEGNLRADELKSSFRLELIKKTIGEKEEVTPQKIVKSLLNYCINLTTKCRTYMEENKGTKQPKDYAQFPGKFDHTTCVAFRVGEVSDVSKDEPLQTK